MTKYPRGNAAKEYKQMELSMLVFLECRQLSADDIKTTFERVGDYIKPVPKLGRPKLTADEKLQRKLNKERKKGILNIEF